MEINTQQRHIFVIKLYSVISLAQLGATSQHENIPDKLYIYK